MRIPQPPNWESEPEFIKPPMKLVLRNNALADGNGVPAITVATGEAIEPDQAPEEMLNDSIAGFANMGLLHDQVTVSVTRPDWPVRS